MYDWDELFSTNNRVEYTASDYVTENIIRPFQYENGIQMIRMSSTDDGLWDIHFDENTVFTQADVDAVAKYSSSQFEPKPSPYPPYSPSPTPTPTPTPSPAPPVSEPVEQLPDFVVRGTQGNDVLIGNALGNFMHGHRGNDTISGGDGDDIIRGGKDNDIIDGGEGNDIIYGDKDTNTVNGGEGNDILIGGIGINTFVYTSGDDIIYNFNKTTDTLDIQSGDYSIEEILTPDSNTVHYIINEL
jgi:Ca2+-binding RTX toxin-like protein